MEPEEELIIDPAEEVQDVQETSGYLLFLLIFMIRLRNDFFFFTPFV